MRFVSLLALLLGAAACAPAPATTIEAVQKTRSGLNARLFGATVDLRLDDGSEVQNARAVVVTPETVRFVADGDRADSVRSVPLGEVVEIVERVGPRGGERALLLGAAPGLAFLFVLSRVQPGALDGSLGKAGFGVAGIGALVGWRRARDRVPQGEIVLYRPSPD